MFPDRMPAQATAAKLLAGCGPIRVTQAPGPGSFALGALRVSDRNTHVINPAGAVDPLAAAA